MPWPTSRKGAERAGRSLDGFQTYALVNLLMLEKGETLESERVVAECGPAIMANVHYLVDFVRETGREPPDYVLPIWEEYMDFHMSRDAATRHQKLHESHYSYLDPEEARFMTPEMIRNFCIAGHPEEIVDQLRDAGEAGTERGDLQPADREDVPPDRGFFAQRHVEDVISGQAVAEQPGRDRQRDRGDHRQRPEIRCQLGETSRPRDRRDAPCRWRSAAD